MGQSKKKRQCPAIGREITSAECGGGRHTRLACPPACPFDPFTLQNYAQALAIEDGLTPKVLRRMADELGSAYPVPKSDRNEDQVDCFVRSVHARFFERDVAGKTFAERWEATGYAGLTNDERVIFGGQAQLRVALLEVHRVGAEHVEAQDRLDLAAPPLLLCDRSLAAMAERFSTLLTWVYPQPHYARLNGMADVVPDYSGMEPEEIVRAIVQHLGGPAEQPALRVWLQKNFALMHRAFAACTESIQQRRFEQLGASFHTVVYRLRASMETLAQRIAAQPAVVESPVDAAERKAGYTQGWVWLDENPDADVLRQPGRPTLGNVALGPQQLCLKGGLGERFAALRAAFESSCGDAVELVSERTDDVARQLALRHPPQFDPALVPPALLALTPQYKMNVSLVNPTEHGDGSPRELELRIVRDNVHGYAERALPGLDGRTPREAARDPLLRPRLMTMVKQLVRSHDQACRRLGASEDINGLVRELGLTELDFPPPPPRTPAQQEDLDELFDDAQDEAAVYDRPPAPPLPAGPLSKEDIGLRFAQLSQCYLNPLDMVDDCDADSDGLIEFMEQYTEDWHDKDHASLIASVATVWYLVYPPDFYAAPLEWKLLEDQIQRSLHMMAEIPLHGSVAGVEALVQKSSQPALFACAISVLMTGLDPKGMREPARQNANLQALTLLHALIETLHVVAHK